MDNNQILPNFQTPQSPVTTDQIKHPSYKKPIIMGSIFALFFIVIMFFIGIYLSKEQNKFILNTNPDKNIIKDTNRLGNVPAKSPNGKFIAYTDFVTDKVNTSQVISIDSYIYDLSLKKIVYSYINKGFEMGDWSPNSKYVSVQTVTAPGTSKIRIIDIDSGKLIDTDMMFYAYSWTTNNNIIIFTTAGYDTWKSDILLFDVENRKVTTIEKSSNFESYNPMSESINFDFKNNSFDYKKSSLSKELSGTFPNPIDVSETYWKINLDTMKKIQINKKADVGN